jgi:hypothetical protein
MTCFKSQEHVSSPETHGLEGSSAKEVLYPQIPFPRCTLTLGLAECLLELGWVIGDDIFSRPFPTNTTPSKTTADGKDTDFLMDK